MRLVAFVLGVSLLSLVVAPAGAVPDLKPYGACVGYSMCQEIDGDAVFCVKAKGGQWVCGQCEACGNGPFLP